MDWFGERHAQFDCAVVCDYYLERVSVPCCNTARHPPATADAGVLRLYIRQVDRLVLPNIMLPQLCNGNEKGER